MIVISSREPPSGINNDTTHLSLGYVANRFAKLAKKCKFPIAKLETPDIYRSKTAIDSLRAAFLNFETDEDETDLSKSAQQTENVVHISVAPWTGMRLLIPANFNICHLSWEQTRLADRADLQTFGTSMSKTLSSFDRVWTCADFVADALKANGFNSVTTFPTPICAPAPRESHPHKLERELFSVRNQIFCPHLVQGPGCGIAETVSGYLQEDYSSRLLDILHRKRTTPQQEIHLFVTQGNPGDARKGLFSTMIGFSLFAASFSGEAYLIVKTPPRNRQMILEEIEAHASDHIRWGWWGSNNIFVLPAYLSDAAQNELYALSDFYVCCPIAEGQNIPLQEAIQCGSYPISPLHTAMSEFLSADLISAISTTPTPMDPLHYIGHSLPRYDGFAGDYLDIADACQRAVDTNQKVRRERVRELQNSHLHRYTEDFLATRFVDEMAQAGGA